MRVLIVDDHDLFRTGLCTLLEEEGFEVSGAASGDVAVALSRSFAPDVVLMDMNMPEMSGIEATRMLLRERPETAVVMLSVIADDERVLDAVRAGASGYMLKDASLAEIVAGVRSAVAGHAAITPRVAGALVASVRSAARRHSQQAPMPVLSQRDRDVLTLLAMGRDNAEIARRLDLRPNTVKQHVSRLFEKLGVENRVQAAVYAIRAGVVEDHDSRPSNGAH
jgi:two-component system, NarL family, nitrate/nitrite response regulator NarL